MRISALAAVLILSNLVVSSTASAIMLFMSPPTATSLALGDTFTIELRMATEGETHITSVFASVIVENPNVLAFVGGTSPGAILFNFSTYEGLVRATQPVDGVPGDAPGRIRAASFASLVGMGTGISSPNELLATLTFQVIGAGFSSISPLLIVGSDEITVARLSVTGSVTVVPGPTVGWVPEPGTGLLVGLGLAGLGITRRRDGRHREISSRRLRRAFPKRGDNHCKSI
jgi:hypothetical protein